MHASLPSLQPTPAQHTAAAEHGLLHKLAMRQAGHLRGLLSPPEQAAMLQHHRTVRGHRAVVYCTACDAQGQYLVTGADDRLVKVCRLLFLTACRLHDGHTMITMQVWSLSTFLLLAVCRGHDAEVTELSINATNTLLASCSNDSTIRVWSLQVDARHPEKQVDTVVIQHT